MTRFTCHLWSRSVHERVPGFFSQTRVVQSKCGPTGPRLDLWSDRDEDGASPSVTTPSDRPVSSTWVHQGHDVSYRLDPCRLRSYSPSVTMGALFRSTSSTSDFCHFSTGGPLVLPSIGSSTLPKSTLVSILSSGPQVLYVRVLGWSRCRSRPRLGLHSVVFIRTGRTLFSPVAEVLRETRPGQRWGLSPGRRHTGVVACTEIRTLGEITDFGLVRSDVCFTKCVPDRGSSTIHL